MNTYYVYILTSWNNKVMYIGVTNNLERRICEHKHKLLDGFSHGADPAQNLKIKILRFAQNDRE